MVLYSLSTLFLSRSLQGESLEMAAISDTSPYDGGRIWAVTLGKKPGGRNCLICLEKLFAFFQGAAFLPILTAHQRQPSWISRTHILFDDRFLVTGKLPASYMFQQAIDF